MMSLTHGEVAKAKGRSYADYNIVWICALPIELAAAQAMLDEEHEPLHRSAGDHNTYTFGRIGQHSIALACLPSMGPVPAAVVATNVRQSFPNLKIGLLVGIGGGAPDVEREGFRDIRLGDVVVSEPESTFGGVVEYDMGKTLQDGRFTRTGSLNRPPEMLLTALRHLQAKHFRHGCTTHEHIDEMFQRNPQMRARFSHPGVRHDKLFRAPYSHQSLQYSCHSCSAEHLVDRPARLDERPTIHYGIIASGNRVIRDAITRDQDALEFGALCFEMEAAGLMNHFPCLVIRGISDYADSHKNDLWQPYAATTAAALTKELLLLLPHDNPKQAEVLDQPQVAFPNQQLIFGDVVSPLPQTYIPGYGLPGISFTNTFSPMNSPYLDIDAVPLFAPPQPTTTQINPSEFDENPRVADLSDSDQAMSEYIDSNNIENPASLPHVRPPISSDIHTLERAKEKLAPSTAIEAPRSIEGPDSSNRFFPQASLDWDAWDRLMREFEADQGTSPAEDWQRLIKQYGGDRSMRQTEWDRILREYLAARRTRPAEKWYR